MPLHGADQLSETASGRPLWQRLLLIVAAIGFAAGVYLSIRAKPDLIEDLNYRPLLLLALIAVPVTVMLNAEEFRLSGRLVGRDFSRLSALEVTIVASVANMLPIPGGTMVRIAALKSQGASLKDGTMATLLVSFLWVALAFLYSGLWLMVPGTGASRMLGGAFCLFGGMVLVATVVVALRLPGSRDTILHLTVIKFGLVLIDSTRIYLCLLILGVDGSFIQASVLSVSSVVGAAVSIVPAGLGIREAVAALLAPWIALDAASGYLSTSLNRIVGLAVLTPISVYLGLRAKSGSKAS